MTRPKTDVQGVFERMRSQSGAAAVDSTITTVNPAVQISSSTQNQTSVSPATRKPEATRRVGKSGVAGSAAAQDPLVKSTFSLTLSDLQRLRAEQSRRRACAGGRLHGTGADLSALIREAIRRTYKG